MADQNWRFVFNKYVSGLKDDIETVALMPFASLNNGIDLCGRALGKVHSFLVKKSFPAEKAAYMAVVDGTDKSDAAATILSGMLRPTDTLEILYVDDPAVKKNSSMVAAKYNAMCGPNITFKVVPKIADRPLADTIVEYSLDIGANCIAISVEGQAALAGGLSMRLVTGAADAIVAKTRCNVLCVQDQSGVFFDSDVRAGRGSVKVLGGLLRKR